MPECPELKLSVESIRPLLLNKRIVNVFPISTGRYRTISPKGFTNFINHLDKNVCNVISLDTYGKFMYWTFTNDWYMFCTFGMSGQFSPQQDKHSCFGFSYGEDVNNYKNIYFNDPRHFGTIQFTNNPKDLTSKLNKLGWDPFKFGMDEKWINFVVTSCQNSSKPIGQLLLDQSIYSGTGNYIRCEALYLSKISPWRKSSSLNEEEIKLLCQSIFDVMNESYAAQGATILTYKNTYGEKGKYSSFFKVYKKEVDPFGNKVIYETTPEGRTIHWCPEIQK